MPGPTHESASCSCGQVVFDITGRKEGETLSCPWCSKKYRYLGSNTIAPFEEAEEKEAGGTSEGGGLAERMKAHSAMRKRQQAAAQASEAGPSDDKPRSRAKGRKAEVPGGALRMIAFIVVCNAIALVLLQVFFARQINGSRATPWGWTIPRYKVPWPELVTLAIGHLCSFVAWACSVYLLHRGQKRKAVE